MKRLVCAECDNPVGYWFHGWKHQRSGSTTKPSCGRKPRVVVEVDTDTGAWTGEPFRVNHVRPGVVPDPQPEPEPLEGTELDAQENR